MNPNKDNPIGIIDSGVGGLSVASVIINNLPKESIIYLADSKNIPYGEKKPKTIYRLSKKMINFLINRRAKLIVIACNTITITSIDGLRREFNKIPIVGIVPVVKKAREKTKNRKIGIYSTLITSKSPYQKKLIAEFASDVRVVNVGSSKLATLIEKEKDRDVEKVLKSELKVFRDEGVDVIALGCSHFPLVKSSIAKLLPNVLILDSAAAVTRQVKRILEQNRMLSSLSNPNYNFFTTGNKNLFSRFVQKTVGKKLTIKAKIERISFL